MPTSENAMTGVGIGLSMAGFTNNDASEIRFLSYNGSIANGAKYYMFDGDISTLQ